MNNKYKHTLLVLDSDMLRALSERDFLLKNDPYFDFSNVDTNKFALLSKYSNELSKIMELVEMGLFFLCITETTYRESHYSKTFQIFMEKYCHCPDHECYDAPSYIKKKNELANAYTTIGDPPPMHMVYSAELRRYVPANDAHIMAETTMVGGILLTGNLKHFYFDPRANERNNNRASGIVGINVAMGYDYANQAVSKPISAKIIASMYDDGSAFNNDAFKQVEAYPAPCANLQYPYYK